jgi:hypothetical protein
MALCRCASGLPLGFSRRHGWSPDWWPVMTTPQQESQALTRMDINYQSNNACITPRALA